MRNNIVAVELKSWIRVHRRYGEKYYKFYILL